jgi:cobalt-zinc-cadmium efflux system outer membrane protein
MNMMRCGVLLAAVWFAGCSVTGNVDDVGPVGSAAGRLEPTYIRPRDGEIDAPLDAARVVQIALARHPEVLAELARLDAVEAERVQAGLLRNPMLELMLLRPEGGGRFAIEAGWMQSLFDLLTRSRRVALADAHARRERAESAARLLEVGFAAQDAFYEAVAANERMRLLAQELALETRQLDLQSRLVAQGIGTRADLLRMRAMLDERRHMNHEREAERIEAEAMLAERLGLDSRARLRLPGTFPLPTLPAADVAAWQQRALAARPDLAASAAAVAAARHERRLERGALRNSEPELGVQLERDGEGMSMVGPSLRVALPLFDDGQARGARNDALLREALEREEAQRRRVLLEVERALDLLFAASERWRLVSDHLERARSAAALAARDYERGNSDLMARLDAERSVLAVEQQVLDVRLVFAKAQVELQRALGGG